MTEQLDIRVPGAPDSSYTITIGADVLASVWPRIEADFGRRSPFIVTDRNLVVASHLGTLISGRDVPTFVIDPPGEKSKHIGTVIAIIEAMEKAFLGRDTLVIALGGGTVGDIAGFAASIFKRGVPVVQIPTTTVAQADSAVGGKTGVDSSLSKNAFGSFWHPSAVYIDVATLTTLDERQYRAGLVESVKHAIIADKSYFDFIEQNIDAILARDRSVLKTIAGYNCKIKGSVVQEDPTEKNKRRILNYGHTVGHAVEAAGGYELLHGEAVAVGIVAAGLIEAELGLSQPGRPDRIRKVLEKLTVPVKLPKNLAEDKLIEIIRHDKKAVAKWPKFVLIRDLGQVHCENGQWAVEVDRDIVERVLRKLKQ